MLFLNSGGGSVGSRRSRVARAFPPVGVLLLALALMAPMLHGADAPPAGKPAAPEAFGKIYRCQPGPWGDLEYYHVHLELPDWMLDSVSTPPTVPRWYFPGATADTLRALFQKAGLPAALQSYLLDPSHQAVQEGVLAIFPPQPDVIALTPGQRSVIYTELAKHERNTQHARPIFITNGDPDSWFENSSLRPELLEVTKKLLWKQGDILCFSDLGLVLGMARSRSETRDLLRTLNRSSAIMLQLNLQNMPDFGELAAYWTAGSRNRDIEPVLRSAAQTQGNELLDATYLLPPIPRRYAYSYYSGEVPIVGTLPNCHWTSLNFFKTTPLDYHRDPRLTTLHIAEDYTPVSGPMRFGDVLMFLTDASFPLHSCVYIADDIVYTKNGQSATIPWVLMKLGDVKRIYSRNQPITIQTYRLKAPVEQANTGE